MGQSYQAQIQDPKNNAHLIFLGFGTTARTTLLSPVSELKRPFLNWQLNRPRPSKAR